MERGLTSSSSKAKLQQIKKMVTLEACSSVSPASKPITLQINTCHHFNKCPSAKCKLSEPPIVLQKKSPTFTKHQTKKIINQQLQTATTFKNTEYRSPLKAVQEFKPIDIPVRKPIAQPNYECHVKSKTKQIEVRIENEKDDKDCLRKLFKKINKLTDELNESQKKRAKLQLELENYKDLENRQREYQRRIRELELAKHKGDLQIATLKQLLANQRNKPPQIVEKFIERPIQVIKQIPVQKIVEVQVQVAKLVPGPQRIIEKFVEVPKYIEVQKKVPIEIIKQVIKEVPKEVYKTVSVPEYVQRPIYIDKPVYVEKVVEKKVEVPVQVPIEVPIEVPVYVDRPIPAQNIPSQPNYLSQLQSQRYRQMHELQIRKLQQEIIALKEENGDLLRNIQLLKRHNQQKNREVQQFISNTREHTHLTKGALGGYSFRIGARSMND